MKTRKVIHNGFKGTDIAQTYVNFANKIGGKDILKVVQCENAGWDPLKEGDGGDSIGFCQINLPSHPEYTKEQLTSDRQFQLEQCVKLRKEKTAFYALNRVNEKTGKLCHQEALQNFTFQK